MYNTEVWLFGTSVPFPDIQSSYSLAIEQF